MRITLITSGQPSLNPRLVKEADALCDNGYKVTIIYQYWNKWGTALDEKFLLNKSWEAILAGGTPNAKKLTFWHTRLRNKFYTLISRHISMKFGLAENAVGRSNYLLFKAALHTNADLYIGHNLAALPIAVKAAKKNNAKCGFDAEDFHRHEISDDINSKHYQLAKFIEDKYLTQVDYFTAASPLIAAQYQKNYPNLKPIVINNVFSIDFLEKVSDKRKCNELKLFWFSQTIGKGRGIEDAITAIALLKRKHINVSLLGNIDDEHLIYFKNIAKELGLLNDQLIFIKPISPDEIFELANDYDIGLALEEYIPYNRNICLTNKIFTYLTAGLAIIASETLAQKEFVSTYPKIGKTYPIGDVNALAKLISKFDEDRAFLHQTKLESSALAKEKMNWEIESNKFIELIENALTD